MTGMAKLVLKSTPAEDRVQNGVLHRLFPGIRDSFDQWGMEWSISISKSDRRIYEYVLPCRQNNPGLGIQTHKTEPYLPCI